MSRHAYSTSHVSSASILLPTAEVIPLPSVNPGRAIGRSAFTKATVRKMHCPSGHSEQFFWDANCRGLGIRALSSGRRSWIFQYRDEHPPTLTAHLGRGERILQQFERFTRPAEIGFSVCQSCQHVRSVDTASGRKQRETLFHQSDSLLELAAIRCRPPQGEHPSAAQRRKVVFLRQLEQLRR